MYIITAKRMISGLVLKYLKGEPFVISEGYETALPASSRVPLTETGELFMNGEHVVEVMNRSSIPANYSVYLGIN